MLPNRYRKIALYIPAAVGLLLVLVVLLFVVEQRRTQAEMGSVLSALFSDEVLHDVNKGGYGAHNPDCHSA